MIDGLSAAGAGLPPAIRRRSRLWEPAALRLSPRVWKSRSRPDCGMAFRAARWRSKQPRGRARRKRCRATGPAAARLRACAGAPCRRPVRAGVQCPCLLASSGQVPRGRGIPRIELPEPSDPGSDALRTSELEITADLFRRTEARKPRQPAEMQQQPYWFITAFSGLGGNAGSVFWPRSSSSAYWSWMSSLASGGT